MGIPGGARTTRYRAFLIAGAVTLIQGSVGLYWLVPGVIFCFLAAFSNAWVLLIEINR
jgi:hypothetical protein